MHTNMTKGAASAKTAAPERRSHPPAINTLTPQRQEQGEGREKRGERLTSLERADLFACEHKIEKGLATFWEVGTAISQIRAARLYRETHATFEDYLQHKWGLGGRRARQLCAAAGVNDSLNDGTIDIKLLPNTESQARVLAGVPVEQRKEVYADLLKIPREGPPTAREINEALNDVGQSGKQKAESRNGKGPKPDLQQQAQKIAASIIDDCKAAEAGPAKAEATNRERFRIARYQRGWRIKRAPGWSVAAFVLSLREAGDWIKSQGVDPENVSVTDSSTWQTLEYWNTHGKEPMEVSPDGVKWKEVVLRTAAEKILDKAGAALNALLDLRGLLRGNDERLRAGLNVAIARVDEVEKKFRRKAGQ